jgi:DHA1 family multidrug resistance protein-like MFS transporter
MKINAQNLKSGEPWRRNLAVIWLAELIAISGFTVFMPFMPYYVQELGVTRLEEVEFWSGLLIASQAVTMAAVAPLWGSLADRYGRKIMVVRAMLGGSVVIALMGLTQNVGQLLALRALQGALTGTVPAATTLVASSAPPERRGATLGLLQMAIYLGASVGPLLGGLIADQVGYRATFWVTGGLLFGAGVLMAVLVHEEFTSPEETDSREKSHLWDGLVMVLRTRALVIVFGIRVLVRMGMRIIGPMLPLFVQQIAAPGARVASLTGTIEGASAAASAVAAVTLGRISDRIGYRRILLVCSTAACVLSGLMAGVHNTTQLLILRALTGAAMGGILASVSALQATLAPKERFGAVYGVDTSVVAGANAVAPMIGAGMAASWGLTSVFLGAAAVYAVATVVVAAAVSDREMGQRST